MVTEYLYTILYILYRCLSDLWSALQPRRAGVSVWHQRGAPQTTQGWCVGSEDVQEMPPVGRGPVNTSAKSEACLCHAFCPVTQQCDWRQVCLAWGGALPGRNPLRPACACVLSHSSPLRLFGTVAPQGSSVHGIHQARILEWVAMLSSRGSSRPRNQSLIFCVACIASRFSDSLPSEPPGKSRPALTWSECGKTWRRCEPPEKRPLSFKVTSLLCPSAS